MIPPIVAVEPEGSTTVSVAGDVDMQTKSLAPGRRPAEPPPSVSDQFVVVVQSLLVAPVQ